MSHLCDCMVVDQAVWKDNVLATRMRIPPFSATPLAKLPESIYVLYNCKNFGPATGVIWALRAQRVRNESETSSRGLSTPQAKKSQTELKKSQNS